MKEFKASTTIHAPAEKIWAILTQVATWPEWDPYCEKIEGRVAPGEKIKAFSKLSPGRAFPVKVTELVPNQKMTWTGGMPLGLFKGVRTFSLTPKGDNTDFTLHEVFSGPMLALIGGSIPDMTDAFQKFVAGLKSRAEGSR
ncbi:SRPBCC domain-containing protein [Archangium violaceum]|uniref:SRPBCC domain-containing protein n=1 Tax=Archangium violaceum TaxID=83451 RepID=UPI00194E1423|nr:SRPBCC domain-containing protein [Archangium violaceum]QRO01581.1 SRPBCC domain-containing protein [Archangium violaceum]